MTSTQITKFVGPTWGPPGSCRPQMSHMVAPWTLLSGYSLKWYLEICRRVGKEYPKIKAFRQSVSDLCHCIAAYSIRDDHRFKLALQYYIILYWIALNQTRLWFTTFSILKGVSQTWSVLYVTWVNILLRMSVFQCEHIITDISFFWIPDPSRLINVTTQGR